jgi:hypothetical protein
MINPIEWLKTANKRRPKLPHTTEWFNGLTAPMRPGWYERHFTDSPVIGDASMQWWDGACWYIEPYGLPHWRQVGDYPAWRGLAKGQKQKGTPPHGR